MRPRPRPPRPRGRQLPADSPGSRRPCQRHSRVPGRRRAKPRPGRPNRGAGPTVRRRAADARRAGHRNRCPRGPGTPVVRSRSLTAAPRRGGAPWANPRRGGAPWTNPRRGGAPWTNPRRRAAGPGRHRSPVARLRRRDAVPEGHGTIGTSTHRGRAAPVAPSPTSPPGDTRLASRTRPTHLMSLGGVRVSAVPQGRTIPFRGCAIGIPINPKSTSGTATGIDPAASASRLRSADLSGQRENQGLVGCGHGLHSAVAEFSEPL